MRFAKCHIPVLNGLPNFMQPLAFFRPMFWKRSLASAPPPPLPPILPPIDHTSQSRIDPPVIGIDLGTTDTIAAVMEGRRPVIIPDPKGALSTPSYAALKGNIWLIGLPAKRQAITNPILTFYSTKRLIGRRYDDPEVKAGMDYLPYFIRPSATGEAWVVAGGEMYSPSHIAAFFLKHMKRISEKYLGRPVKNAVVTVPAYFNDSQRQATRDAGEVAGLNVVHIINEPTAAALAYGMDKVKKQIIAVYDLGGGTFDISILEVLAGEFLVRSTYGDTMLGGADFDTALIKYFLERFDRETGIDLSSDSKAVQRLRDAAEHAKIELSVAEEADVNLPYLSSDENVPKHMNFKLTRVKYEELIEKLVARTIEPCVQAMKDAGVEPYQIEEVLLVGEMTKMPKVKRTVERIFGRKPNDSVDCDKAVAVGAAIKGAILSGELRDILLLDVIPLSLGIETSDGMFKKIINKNTVIPIKMTQEFSTSEDNQTELDIRVYQGESDIATNNSFLGEMKLVKIPKGPKGTVNIEVTFDVDTDGIISVSAIDLKTGSEQTFIIQNYVGLNKVQIEYLKKEVGKQFRYATTISQESKESWWRRKLLEARKIT